MVMPAKPDRIAASGGTISVVIVNYNGGELLVECLNGLQNQLRAPHEVIMVDNGSADDSIRLATSRYPDIHIITNRENRYFAAGANQGIAASNGDFVLLLNNDCALRSDYLEILAAQLEQDSSLGAAVGKIYRVGGEILDQAGQTLARTRTPHDRGYGEEDAGEYDEQAYLLSAGGVAPLMRREMLDDIKEDYGWLDEDFVQYYEDLDLFWRAHNLGWRILYDPAATAIHHRGATGQSEPAVTSWVRSFAFANLPRNLQGHLLRNRYSCMFKNDNFLSMLTAMPFILYYELKIFAYSLLVKPSLFPSWLRAYGGVGQGLRKRKQLVRKARERGIKNYGSINLKRGQDDGRMV